MGKATKPASKAGDNKGGKSMKMPSTSKPSSSRNARSTVFSRALSERMFLMSHLGPEEGESDAVFLVAGQSGKLYTVRLPTSNGDLARCNCPDQLIRKRTCKHLLFVAHRVLKLDLERDTDHAVKKSATADAGSRAIAEGENTGADGSSEDDDEDGIQVSRDESLRRLDDAYEQIEVAFNRLKDGREQPDASVNAPQAVRRAFELVVPSSMRGASQHGKAPAKEESVLLRPVEAGDECPICYEEFDSENKSIIHCLTGCGRPVHEDCMRLYAAAAARIGDELRCVLCRAPWRFPGEVSPKAGSSHPDIGSRGLLNNGRLIDLSTLADDFIPSSSRLRARDVMTAHDDVDVDDDDIVSEPAGESLKAKAARQKDERAERAKKRAAVLMDSSASDGSRSRASKPAKVARKEISSDGPTRRSTRLQSSSRQT